MHEAIVIDPPKPLSEREEKRKTELEKIITCNFQAFVEVGLALREIRDTKLHRITHNTFDDYFKDRWGMDVRRAYQLIDAAIVVENVNNCTEIEWIPQNEAQARPLVGLEPAEQARLWQKAIETAPDGKITAAHVKKTVKGLTVEKVTKTIAKNRKNIKTSTLISAEFSKSFDAFLAQIQVEIDSGWKTTDRNTVARHLRALLVAVEDD